MSTSGRPGKNQMNAATREACRLSVTERQIILGVLKRNEQLQKDQQYRILRLKAELQLLRRKGALKTTSDYENPTPDPDRTCARCRIEFGRVINRGAYCRACRLKVCKSCREYSFSNTDWVCTVCHKHMEIQAASGEWMNEFVRRPSRRRDNRVYVPAADIIKRTIRRSWTISNPSPRWNAVRGSPEIRPYNSLPRGQDRSNYPSLTIHQRPKPLARTHSPAKRSHSEDIYNEHFQEPQKLIKEKVELEPKEKQPRINPLIKYASKKGDSDESDGSDNELNKMGKGKKKLMHTRSEGAVEPPKRPNATFETSKSVDADGGKGKRVSFDKIECEEVPEMKKDDTQTPVELCDIEPLSGTVFRKVTVRRRRQDMRKMPAVDSGWRRDDLLDILLPEGDDYKLVFISSDSSSKEEDLDDNESTSSHLDECDWDYFEPGTTRIKTQCEREQEEEDDVKERDDVKREQSMEDAIQCIDGAKGACSCGAPTQYIPIPIPVPIPVPISWYAQDLKIRYNPENLENHLRLLPRALWPLMNQTALFWPHEANPFISALQDRNDQVQREQNEEVKKVLEEAVQFTYENTEISEVSSSEGEKEEEMNEFLKNKEEKSAETQCGGYLNSEIKEGSSSEEEEENGEEFFGYLNSEMNETSSSEEEEGDEKISRETRTYTVNKFRAENSSSSSPSTSDNEDDFGNLINSSEDSSSSEDGKVYVVNEESESQDESEGVVFLRCVKLCEEKEAELIRSVEPVVGNCDGTGERAGAEIVNGELAVGALRHAARYTSLVMITQDSTPKYANVSVLTSDTTKIVPDGDVVVQHTNWQDEDETSEDVTVVEAGDAHHRVHNESVTVITGADTLSAVVCLEEGLADDDSWVENLSHDEEEEEEDFANTSSSSTSSSGEEVTLHCTAVVDHEDELRGYHRGAIDFTLHTIVEESCEESEVEQNTVKKPRPPSATDLEKYFYFGLGDGNNQNVDAYSETSSICSESMDSFIGNEDTISENNDPADLASSRLEKYFLSGFTNFKERRDSDGSVGSDSEGRPSPEQRRKRLVRARGTGRSHSSSLDNLISDLTSPEQTEQNPSENSSSSDTDTYDESNTFEKDGQFDTVKRKKNKKKGAPSPSEENKNLEEIEESEEDSQKTPAPSPPLTNKQSRDSGFIGSNDDLIKEGPELITSHSPLNNIPEEGKSSDKNTPSSTPPATNLTRKDSFNNWSSDEETNLMMCKMRQFFKTMVANSNPNSKPTTPVMGPKQVPSHIASPRFKNRYKPPQLIYFENELTRLMKTVPGIRDDQVREIVEYLSSEDTWSDSYDSSDYTSSDLEGGSSHKTALQQQISDSCKQIINKFDNAAEDEEGDEGDGGIIDESHGLNRETAFVYQKLVASFEKMATQEEKNYSPHNSPPLIAKVMHHIGSRLVALMHEVSSGESHASNSPKSRYRRIASSTTTEEDDDDDDDDDNTLENNLTLLEDSVPSYSLLPRSRSHDLLLSEKISQNANDTTEEREISDCERFSWRGSFESALLATDSRNKLSLIGGDASSSASALAIAAKRRSAGDLLFTHKSLSREQLDRVRSCGSIGGANSEDKLWVQSATRPSRRRSSVPDASCNSTDEEEISRSTLPRSLQTGTVTTNSLPRLPTNTPPIHKAQSMYHFLQQNVKSARYRPPGFNRLTNCVPKRAVSAPGLHPTPQRRGRRQQTVVPNDDISLCEAHSSPTLASRTSKSATPSPVAYKAKRVIGGSQEWKNNEEDIDRLVAIHTRSSLSSLGIRSDSLASVYSGAGDGRYGSVTVRGQIEFGLQYNYKSGALEINVKQCKDLAAVDNKRNRSDPYVKVYLLPDKSKSGKRKTKVKKHTLNPVFDECLKFHIALNGLETRTLWLTVWHSDMFGRNDFLGEVMMVLENKVFDDLTPKWYNLQERTEPFDDMLSFKGDILVALKFIPPDMTSHKKGKRSRGALHVLVKEAKSLTAVKANGTSDPFCKSYLLPDKGRSGKQKTSVIKRTVNPIWNYTFIYDDVTLQELAERCLELTVWDHDRLASNEFLGGVRFSLGTGKHYGKQVDWMDATGKELSLWKSMLERPNFWVEGCLSLRPTLDHRTN